MNIFLTHKITLWLSKYFLNQIEIGIVIENNIAEIIIYTCSSSY